MEQVLACDADCHQRSRAGCLDVQSWSAQIEFVGDARGKKVLVVAEHQLVFIELRDEFRLGVEIVGKVGVHAHSGKHPDGAGIFSRIAACVFQRLPGTFEKYAVLRVHHFGLTRVYAEEAGIKKSCVFQQPAGLDVIRVAFGEINTRRFQFVVGEERYPFDAKAEILPELVNIPRPGKASRHADDGDASVCVVSG